MRTSTIWIASLLLATATVQAADAGRQSGVDAPAAFARLKTLVGQWEANTDMGKTRVSYELIAGGSALVERETAAGMPEMLTVYHLDGGRLLLTHYCMAGNQPRLEARSFDPQNGVLRFEFLDATNLASAGTGHMHNVTIRTPDASHLTSSWEFYEGGRLKNTEAFAYSRVR